MSDNTAGRRAATERVVQAQAYKAKRERRHGPKSTVERSIDCQTLQH